MTFQMTQPTTSFSLNRGLSKGFKTHNSFKRTVFIWLAACGVAALTLISTPLLAATAPALGSTSPYAIVSSTFSNTTAGTNIDGDVCYTTEPAATPFISGATVVPCLASTGTDQNAARADLVSQNCTPIGAAVALNAISIDGGTPGDFPPGCYSSTGAMSLAEGTTVNLIGTGVYIFRPGGALNPGANSSIVLADGACANDVFWAPVGATTVGANANFIGNIFRGVADGLSITFGNTSSLIGRALAYGSTVTTANTTFEVPEDCPEPDTIIVNKNFFPDSAETVQVSLSCTSGVVTSSPLDASEAAPAVFTVTEAEPGTTCTATETVPDGYTANETGCIDVPLGSSCEITNIQDGLEDRATFRVIKDFTDDNPMDVEVTIDCNTGLILDQNKDISEDSDVEFVVTSFDQGELNCTVSEQPVTGYLPAYSAFVTTGLGLVSSDLEGCHFEEVVSGQFVCVIVNTPGLVDIEIEKLWVFDGSDGREIDTSYALTLHCNAAIEGGQQYCHGGGGMNAPAGANDNYQSCRTFSGDDSAVFVAQVLPGFPSSLCWVNERVYDNAVEIDNGCENLVISAGVGASCLITNTVFFEGIPTLGQYGVFIMALLILGVGLVVLRPLLS